MGYNIVFKNCCSVDGILSWVSFELIQPDTVQVGEMVVFFEPCESLLTSWGDSRGRLGSGSLWPGFCLLSLVDRYFPSRV